MFGSGLKLDKNLIERARLCAEKAGYSSLEEFVSHLIERELAAFESGDSEEEIQKKLKGLGYIS